MSSTNILSSPTGPRELLTMFAMAVTAVTGKITKKQLAREATHSTGFTSTYHFASVCFPRWSFHLQHEEARQNLEPTTF